MGLKNIAAKAAAVAFRAAGDALEAISYNVKGTASYNASTGTVTRASSATSIRALVEVPTADELGNMNIVREHATGVYKITVKAADLSSAPKTGDTITRASGKVLNVLGVKPGDPTSAIYEIIAEDAA